MRIRQPAGRPGPASCRPGGTSATVVPKVPSLRQLQPGRSYRPWRGLYTCLLVSAVAVSATGPAQAQAAAPSSAGGAALIQAMTSDLRHLVSANEVYRAKNTRYAAGVGDLTGYHASSGVTVTFIAATANGWSGKATAAGLPGKSCVVSVGSVATPPKTDATGRTGPDAVVVCDPA
jgi:hypothetical protein